MRVSRVGLLCIFAIRRYNGLVPITSSLAALDHFPERRSLRRGDRRRLLRMFHEVDLLIPIFRPEINVQYIMLVFDLAAFELVVVPRVTSSRSTHLQSTSLPVFLSITTNRIQGGGVIGRRSCSVLASNRHKRHRSNALTLSPKPHILALKGCCTTSSLFPCVLVL